MIRKMRLNKIIYIYIIIAMLLVACDAATDTETGVLANELPEVSVDSGLTATPRVTDKKILAQGEQLFLANCSICHGKDAAGTKEWKKPDKSGKYPPPPLNGTAHAWHHSTEILLEVIKDGTVPDGNMPSWEGILSDKEILLIIAWFQSLWPDQIFKTWQEIDLNSRED